MVRSGGDSFQPFWRRGWGSTRLYPDELGMRSFTWYSHIPMTNWAAMYRDGLPSDSMRKMSPLEAISSRRSAASAGGMFARWAMAGGSSGRRSDAQRARPRQARKGARRIRSSTPPPWAGNPPGGCPGVAPTFGGVVGSQKILSFSEGWYGDPFTGPIASRMTHTPTGGGRGRGEPLPWVATGSII